MPAMPNFSLATFMMILSMIMPLLKALQTEFPAGSKGASTLALIIQLLSPFVGALPGPVTPTPLALADHGAHPTTIAMLSSMPPADAPAHEQLDWAHATMTGAA